MDIEAAIAAHAQWRVKLRQAIDQSSMLDVATVSADNCCDLGKWLHGPAKHAVRSSEVLKDCIEKHAHFHREAGKVAQAINANRKEEAAAMLEAGKPYAAASSAVGVALSRLKRELVAS